MTMFASRARWFRLFYGAENVGGYDGDLEPGGRNKPSKAEGPFTPVKTGGPIWVVLGREVCLSLSIINDYNFDLRVVKGYNYDYNLSGYPP